MNINPKAPLPYKGMDVLTEISRTIMPQVIREFMNNRDTMITRITEINMEEISYTTVKLAKSLINELNQIS